MDGDQQDVQVIKENTAHRDAEHHGEAHAPGRRELPRDADKRTHAQEGGENEIIDKQGIDDDMGQGFVHECTSAMETSGGFVSAFLRLARHDRQVVKIMSQMASAMNPPGGSTNSTQGSKFEPN